MSATPTARQHPRPCSEERSGGVMTIRLNRPEKLNALDAETCRSLVHSLLRAARR